MARISGDPLRAQALFKTEHSRSQRLALSCRPMSDSLLHVVDQERGLSLVLADLTATSQEAEVRHFAGRVAAMVLSKALTGAALLGANLKEHERQSLQLTFAGALRTAMAESDSDGNLRGYATPAALPGLDDGGVALPAALGASAQMAVVRSRKGSMVHSGSVSCEQSAPRHCIQEYLDQSEQSQAVIELHTGYASGGITSARGSLLRMLPNGDRPAFEELKLAFDGGQVFELLGSKRSLGEIADDLIPEHFRQKVAPVSRPLRFHCSCSRARVGGMLAALGAMEVRKIAIEDQGTEINCAFCNATYEVTAEQLHELADKLDADRADSSDGSGLAKPGNAPIGD